MVLGVPVTFMMSSALHGCVSPIVVNGDVVEPWHVFEFILWKVATKGTSVALWVSA